MLEEQLSAFATENNITGKGALCVVLVVTRHAINTGLPLVADTLLTEKKRTGEAAGKSSSSKHFERLRNCACSCRRRRPDQSRQRGQHAALCRILERGKFQSSGFGHSGKLVD